MPVPMELSRIIISEVNEQQVIYLKELEGNRTFPILIGIFEATSLDRTLKGFEPPRPLTHDATAMIIRAFGAEVQDVIVDTFEQQMYHAKVRIGHENRLLVVDLRPHAEQSVIGFAGMSCFHKQISAGGRYIAGTIQSQAVAAEQQDCVLGLGESFCNLAFTAQIPDGFDFITVGIANDEICKFIEFSRARVGNDQRRATVSSLGIDLGDNQFGDAFPVEFSSTTYSVDENAASATITVTLGMMLRRLMTMFTDSSD